MITLDSTLKSLEIVLAGAITTTQLAYTLDYVDLLTTDQSVSAVGTNDGVSNNTTAVTVLAAPSSGHTRQVKFLTVYNQDTVAATITVQLNNNCTTRIMIKNTLNSGDTLQYVDE